MPHQAPTVTFGGLKGEVAYDDQAFGLDPDIQQMFYGMAEKPEGSGDLGGPGGDAAP